MYLFLAINRDLNAHTLFSFIYIATLNFFCFYLVVRTYLLIVIKIFSPFSSIYLFALIFSYVVQYQEIIISDKFSLKRRLEAYIRNTCSYLITCLLI
jgi:hypothetical protein